MSWKKVKIKEVLKQSLSTDKPKNKAIKFSQPYHLLVLSF